MNVPYMAPQQAKIMSIVSLVMAPISGLVTIYFPAGLQLFFFMTGALQYLQTWVFYQPWLRRWAGLPPLTPVSPAQPQTSPFSAQSASWQAPRTISTTATPARTASFSDIRDSLKGGIRSASEKISRSAEGNKKKQLRKQASDYEERRALEEEEKYHARQEERNMRRRERQQ